MNQHKEQNKEIAVQDKRFWLKISNACNNNCIFCHDSEHKSDISFEDTNLLMNKIQAAFDSGNSRLILSGGEATIHPDFLKLAEFSKDIGFKKIQVITNGRMFSYPSFTSKAVKSGINEATFSIHGHTAELHDKLTGIEGSFGQAYKGIQNLLKTKRCIVNIDIVINKLNYMHVEDIINTFSKLNIFEYDLLYIIPFGNAFINKDKLFFDYEDAAPYLKKIFSYARKPDYYIWTNRFPPELLEGDEDLIQDPHKLYDEVLGRPDLYEGYYETKKFHCHPDHCFGCFIKKFCNKFLFYMDMLDSNKHDQMHDGSNLNEIVDLDDDFFKKNKFESDYIIVLNKKNSNIIVDNKSVIAENSDKIQFKIQGYEKLSIAKDEYSNLFKVIKEFNFVNIINCTTCLNENSKNNFNQIFNKENLEKNSRINMRKLVEEFILQDYFVKSLRCKNCKLNSNCRGMHINFIRTFGFKVLKPIK